MRLFNIARPRSGGHAALILALALLALAVPPTASAAPVFNLDLHHNPSHFTPGDNRGSAQVRTETEGSPTENETQRISIFATGGAYTLGFDPDGPGPQGVETTADLPLTANAAAVRAALEGLPSIGAGDVAIDFVGGGGQASSLLQKSFNVTFTGALAQTDVTELVVADGAQPLVINPEYWIDIYNVGADPTSGQVTLTLALPPGITFHHVRTHAGLPHHNEIAWSCPGSPGDSLIVCTTSDPIERRYFNRQLKVAVQVAGSVPEGQVRTAQAKVSGGGTAADALASEPTPISSAPAPAGVVAPSFLPDFFEADGLSTERQAGAHPDLLVVPFDFNTRDVPVSYRDSDLKLAAGSIRNLHVDTPPGFLGNPTAVGECPQADFLLASCPTSSYVGRIDFATEKFLGIGDYSHWARPVFNLLQPRGVVSDLGFVLATNPVHIRASLDPANRYAVTTTVPDINETLPPIDQRLTLWGVPADPSHDSERCPAGLTFSLQTDSECPSDGPLEPFLTLPAQCEEDNTWRLHSYDFWQSSGDFGPDIAHTMDGKMTDCGDVPFDPTVSVAPTTNAADSPSGLDVTIELPQNDTCEQIVPAPPAGETQYDCGIATSPLRDAEVTLPEGLTVNPASANGLDACTPAQIGLGTDDPVQCPDGSKVADVEVISPALPDPIEGAVFLATPHDNPFNTLLAGYIVLSEPDLGLLVKIPGRIDVNPATGQLSGTFTDNPQLPFSRFELRFKGGAHSSLITPKTCGNYTANAQFSAWSGKVPAPETSSFAIARGANGAPCATSEAALPNAPGFDAGPVSPVSKNFSPFELHLRRDDGSQRFSALGVEMPPGLTGKLAGAELCPEGTLAAAAAKSGRAEQASPSCPLNSRVGIVEAAAGAGPSPYYAQGTAYLSGPYKGAPISIATIVPAVAGPFDLGNVVVRAPVFVDPVTAKLSTTTDPLPQMLQGIPLNVRTISVAIDRPEFTLTGTSCNPSAVGGLLTSTLGQVAPLSVRYQLSDCRRLGFKPKMTLRLKGGTKRGKHPQLTAVVAPRPGDANIASVSVAFPRSEFLENAHIRTICTRPDFAADNCPKGAVYGRSVVHTPLLDYPLVGNVYLRSSDNLLPDLVPDLRGPAHQPLRVEAAGRTDSVRGGIRNSFDFFPDAPFSRAVLKMQGGNKGLLVNSRDICARTYRAKVKFRAHNGRAHLIRPKLVAQGCKKKRGKKAKRGGHKRKGKRGAKSNAVAHRSAVR